MNNKFGHVFISGLAWIAISVAIGVVGIRVGGILGSVMSWGGLLYGVLCISTLVRITRLQLAGMRMAREEPERFAQAKAAYEAAQRDADMRMHDRAA